jgi:excisionase family DNA binding protein
MTSGAYLTVKEAASALAMTDDGVRKLIRSGRIRAIKQSERKTLIPRPAFDAYVRKINGQTTQPLGRAKAAGSLNERLAAFQRDAGMAPDEYLSAWLKSGSQSETADEMALAVAAFGLVAEQRAANGPGLSESAQVTAEDYRILQGGPSANLHNAGPVEAATRRI